jgi:hypothetical protein
MISDRRAASKFADAGDFKYSIQLCANINFEGGISDLICAVRHVALAANKLKGAALHKGTH